METATVGEIALFAVGLIGSIVGSMSLRDATRRHTWIRCSGNERARRISARRVRGLAARLVACAISAVVGGIGAISTGWFFHGAGRILALGLGVSVAASILDAVEARAERFEPDIRAELAVEDQSSSLSSGKTEA